MNVELYLSTFRAILAQADALSILLALGISWGFAQWVKFPIHKLFDGAWHAWLTRSACTATAGLFTYWNWPNEWKVTWAFFIGFASPWIWHWGVRVLYRYFPSCRAVLSAQKESDVPPAA